MDVITSSNPDYVYSHDWRIINNVLYTKRYHEWTGTQFVNYSYKFDGVHLTHTELGDSDWSKEGRETLLRKL